MAYRRVAEIYRSGQPDISSAIRAGNACWAIDDETILAMRAKGVPYIGVRVKETGDKYLTRIEEFFDRRFVTIKNYSGRGGALQRFLPLYRFVHRTGSIKL